MINYLTHYKYGTPIPDTRTEYNFLMNHGETWNLPESAAGVLSQLFYIYDPNILYIINHLFDLAQMKTYCSADLGRKTSLERFHLFVLDYSCLRHNAVRNTNPSRL